MKIAFRFGIISLALLLVGCAPRSYVPETTYDGLIRLKDSGMDEAWVRPDFDPNLYSRIMFQGAGIEYRLIKRSSRVRMDNQSQFPISEENRIRLRKLVADEFRKELLQITEYELAEAAGPDTLLLTVALKDVVSNVPPEQIGQYAIYISEVGSASLVLEFKDSESGAILFRGVDRRAADRYGRDLHRSLPATNWLLVQRLAKTWAKGLRTGIDDMRNEHP